MILLSLSGKNAICENLGLHYGLIAYLWRIVVRRLAKQKSYALLEKEYRLLFQYFSDNLEPRGRQEIVEVLRQYP